MRDFDPVRAGRLPAWRLYHRAFLLDQALGITELVATQRGRLDIAPYQLVSVLRALPRGRSGGFRVSWPRLRTSSPEHEHVRRAPRHSRRAPADTTHRAVARRAPALLVRRRPRRWRAATVGRALGESACRVPRPCRPRPPRPTPRTCSRVRVACRTRANLTISPIKPWGPAKGR